MQFHNYHPAMLRLYKTANQLHETLAALGQLEQARKPSFPAGR